MWVYALWGLVGAACMRGLVFAKACERVKGWPWRLEVDGPGGGPFAISQFIHLGAGAAVAAGVSTADWVTSGAVALGVGAAAPAVLRELARYVEHVIPTEPESSPREVPSQQKRNVALPEEESDVS